MKVWIAQLLSHIVAFVQVWFENIVTGALRVRHVSAQVFHFDY